MLDQVLRELTALRTGTASQPAGRARARTARAARPARHRPQAREDGNTTRIAPGPSAFRNAVFAVQSQRRRFSYAAPRWLRSARGGAIGRIWLHSVASRCMRLHGSGDRVRARGGFGPGAMGLFGTAPRRAHAPRRRTAHLHAAGGALRHPGPERERHAPPSGRSGPSLHSGRGVGHESAAAAQCFVRRTLPWVRSAAG